MNKDSLQFVDELQYERSIYFSNDILSFTRHTYTQGLSTEV